MGRAINSVVEFDPVTDHAEAAGFTFGSQGVNSALETVKEGCFTVECNFNEFIVFISANGALLQHLLLLFGFRHEKRASISIPKLPASIDEAMHF
jgi:hypothetical protein